MAKPRRESVHHSQVREWHVKRALESVTALAGVVNELTLDEAIYCLNLESTSQRRRAVLAALIRRAVKMNKLEYTKKLKETYDGPTTVQNPR